MSLRAIKSSQVDWFVHGCRKCCCAQLHNAQLSRQHDWPAHHVRKSFTDYFVQKHRHQYVPSLSVIPKKGQGTYFTNAGMNQFTSIFLGTAEPGSEMSQYRRVTNSQKCVRVGGKHSDLQDVGRDLHHHTFFEMLGNWSFGDYFKKKACVMALDLLKNVYKIPQNRLFFTFLGGDKKLGLDPDWECRERWLELNVPNNRILPFGMKDNFWDMGETGPCGPCTEIHYDHVGPNRNVRYLVNSNSSEVVELWNLVFMQYDRQPDGSLIPLPNCHVDTGMGLERLAAVLQGSRSNYDTDLFLPMFDMIQKETGSRGYRGCVGMADIGGIDTAYRIVADHARMSAVCIADGLLPGRADLDHKLRHVIHRSLQQARHILHCPQGTLAHLVDVVVESIGEAFPEVDKNSQKIKDVLNQTEEKYLYNLEIGRGMLQKLQKKDPEQSKLLSGEQIQELHEGRYGTPLSLDIIQDLARERGLALDLTSFENLVKCRQQQVVLKDEGQPSWIALTSQQMQELKQQSVLPTEDVYKYMYSQTEEKYDFSPCFVLGQIVGLLHDGCLVKRIEQGQTCGIVMDKSGFYAESGGQAADWGNIQSKSGCFKVTDVQINHPYILHIGVVESGNLELDEQVNMYIDEARRLGCMRNHTATHLLSSSLRYTLGDIQQRGSDVEDNKLTFDFSYVNPIKKEEVEQIQENVEQSIRDAIPVQRQLKPLQEAMQDEGVVSLVNEVYPSEVFVISVCADEDSESKLKSVELCGGTHVFNTSDLASFCVLKLTGVAQGTKRLVCVTGPLAKQAKMNGRRLQDLLEKLESEMHDGTGPAQWSELVKSINKGLTEDLVPKLDRDVIREKVDRLGEKISMQSNLMERNQLKQEIETQLQVNRPFLVNQLKFSAPKQVAKVLEQIDTNVPLVLVSELEFSTVAVICIPQKAKSRAIDVGNLLCSEVGGKITMPKNKSKYDISVVNIKGSKHGEKLAKCATGVMENLFSEI